MKLSISFSHRGCCWKDIHPVSGKKEAAMNGEDAAIRIQTSSPVDIRSENSTGTVGAVPRRFESSSDTLTSFGNIHFKEEVKSKGLSSIKRSIEGNWIFLHLWNDVLVMLCVIAALLDPLFCYILVVDNEKNCIRFDKKLRITAVVLRSLIDFGYILLIVFHFRIGYTDSKDANNGTLSTIATARRYLLSYLTVDILAALPLPQVVIVLAAQAAKGSHFTISIRTLKFVLIIQYLPRVFRVYLFLKKVRWSSGILPDSAAAKAIFNLFLYMLASHVFGAFWYLFSIERKATCLQSRCHSHPYCPRKYNITEEGSCLDNCSRKASSNDTLPFNFGIFDDAFKYDVVNSTDFIWKVSYCYWWGLQNLSSLGQGLRTSKHIWEIYFAVSITIAGLVLFALLIGNLQTFLQSTIARLEEMRLKGQDIELWMAYHSLPRDLRKRIKLYEKYKWRKTRGVDVANILHNLPRDLRRDTTRHLCLSAIKSVSMFQNMDEKFLDAVCGFLKPMLYIERNFIVREGEPLDEMIFIIHGKLWIYSNSNRDGETFGSSESLKKGDVFGEELLKWVLKDPLLSTVPISTKTVSTHTKVEAFVLSAHDLKNVVSKFWWLISQEHGNDPNFKERWAPLAALVVQAAWRRYFKSKREREKSQLSLATESGNSQPSVTTTIHASRFIARALNALKRRQKRRNASSDMPGTSNNNDLLPFLSELFHDTAFFMGTILLYIHIILCRGGGGRRENNPC
ncbi:cyclic nucleotide-gated ion channel 1-like isoform X1 [Cucurbita moschata]|uniref:Cyclic nucleotide-gated ion channel 1-like isoform X1 n=1 Tax=Cucurbita moschata TaxID=3662 RepID=A0A6J1FZB0_CUCMO|nr:cyclic nucleotide-gated ion channel 1-like isoform X1 [Cucurbita moschata]